MKYVVLKALPQGQQPGDEVDLPEAVGNVFVLAGAARPADPEPEAVAPTSSSSSRRRYQRRDLEAEA